MILLVPVKEEHFTQLGKELPHVTSPSNPDLQTCYLKMKFSQLADHIHILLAKVNELLVK